MENQFDRYNPAELTEKKENVLPGIIGAFLFSLAGAVVYFVLDLIGIIASLSALVAVSAAFFGYGLFSGNKSSIKGVIIAAIAAVVAMLLASYFSYGYGLYTVAKEDGLVLTIWEALSKLPALFTGETVIFTDELYEYSYELDRGVFYKDVGISVIFCVLGAFGYIRSTVQKIKAEKAATAVPQVSSNDESNIL